MDIQLDEPFIIKNFIAHKGLYDHQSPENSMSAFKKAIDNNYIIECDVRLISDGTVVVFHDEQLSRMTNRDGYVKNLTKETLVDYKLLDSDESIPTLEQVLELVDGKVGILIDLKDTQIRVGQLEKAVCKLIRHYKGDVAVQSFNPLSLEWFAKHLPNVLRGQISCFFKGREYKGVSFIRKCLLKRMKFNKRSKPNFISYDINDLPNRFVKKYKGLPLIGWTVTSQEQYRKAFSDVDNIIFEGFVPKVVPMKLDTTLAPIDADGIKNGEDEIVQPASIIESVVDTTENVANS